MNQSTKLFLGYLLLSVLFAQSLLGSHPLEADSTCPSTQSTQRTVISPHFLESETWLEATSPGYLLPTVIQQIAALELDTDEQTSAAYEQLTDVYAPILYGVSRRVQFDKLSAPEQAIHQETLDLVTAMQSALSTWQRSDLLSLVNKAQRFVEAGYDVRMTSTWRRYGRWGELSTTLCEPWVWRGLDVIGASKVIPFGLGMLTHTKANGKGEQQFVGEKARNNLGAVGNKLSFFLSWFHVVKTMLQVKGPLPPLESQRPIGEAYNQYRDTLPAIGVVQEFALDLTELGRGPIIVSSLLAEQEYGMSYTAFLAYLGEVYDTLNRNRRLVTLHPLGSAYLYAALNMIGGLLLVSDPLNFYWNDIKARLADIDTQEKFSPGYYSRACILIGKVLSPVFVGSQFYDPVMYGKTASIAAFIRDNTGPIGKAAGALVGAIQDHVPAAIATRLNPINGLWKHQGELIYNVGIYTTGALSVTVGLAGLVYENLEPYVAPLDNAADQFIPEAVSDYVGHRIPSLLITASAAAAYQYMYYSGLAVFGVPINTIFVGAQVAVLSGGIVYDYILAPIVDFI